VTRQLQLTHVGVVVLAGAFLAWVAVMNGYPLLFNDSARYIDGGIRRYIPSEAPIFYGAFLIPLHLDGVSLWPIPFAQGILLAYILHATLRAFDLLEPRTFLIVAAFLTLFSAAPWFISFVMPDFFTPICVLGMFALFRGWAKFGRLERFVLFGVVLCGLTSHISHIALGLALAAFFGVLHLFGKPAPKPALIAVLSLPILALGGVLGMNLAAKGRLQLTLDGPVMLLARSFADGPAYEYMRDHCGERRWQLCAVYQRLPRDSDQFLWSMTNSAWLYVPGGELRAEAGEITAAAVRERPDETLLAVVSNTLQQLVTFRAGVDFKTWPQDSSIVGVMHRFFPREDGQYAQSLQQQGRLRLDAINRVYTAIVVLSLVGALAIVLAMREANLVEFLLVIAAALVANAAATGALSVVADRYQSRLIWLVPLAFAICLLAYQRQREAAAAMSRQPLPGGDG
jgi:hypothetical protein